MVLTGSPQNPDALWLREPDGKLHGWDDDENSELMDGELRDPVYRRRVA